MTGGFDEVYRNMDAWERQFRKKAEEAIDEIGHFLANYAKKNHQWGNPYSKGYIPTGATDLSTKGGLYESATDYVRGVLSAGMDYNVFLELAREGKWAWLWPAVEANQTTIMGILERHLSNE